MIKVKKVVLAAIFVFGGIVAHAGGAAAPQIIDGTHGYMPETYVEVTDPLVNAELEKFRDRKLGLMMHFGIYSQLGIHESWPLVDAEAKWSRELVDWTGGESPWARASPTVMTTRTRARGS